MIGQASTQMVEIQLVIDRDQKGRILIGSANNLQSPLNGISPPTAAQKNPEDAPAIPPGTHDGDPWRAGKRLDRN